MPEPAIVHLATPEDTARLAQSLAPYLVAGDTLLLAGPIGAGKTHFARSLIQQRLMALGRVEDIPSPTFTLVQTYDGDTVEIWHADLYRLTSVEDIIELGLDEAFDTAITLIEWPDRLGDETPENACKIDFCVEGESRDARVLWIDPRLDRWLSDYREGKAA